MDKYRSASDITGPESAGQGVPIPFPGWIRAYSSLHANTSIRHSSCHPPPCAGKHVSSSRLHPVFPEQSRAPCSSPLSSHTTKTSGNRNILLAVLFPGTTEILQKSSSKVHSIIRIFNWTYIPYLTYVIYCGNSPFHAS